MILREFDTKDIALKAVVSGEIDIGIIKDTEKEVLTFYILAKESLEPELSAKIRQLPGFATLSLRGVSGGVVYEYRTTCDVARLRTDINSLNNVENSH